ncbi:MAG: hypothetical protein ACI8VW_000989, partial [bacterium]
MESGKITTVSRRVIDDLSVAELEATARLERRQLEMLLMYSLKVSGGDFSYIVSPAGKGAYAEQFVQLDAAAVRTVAGDSIAGHEYLNSRRADPSTLTVMRHRKVVQGSVLVHGLPLHFSNRNLLVTHFVQVPIGNGASNTSV